jgi:GcrA cell cycle regulator
VASGDVIKQVQIMEPSNWAPEHSDALREHLARGISFSQAAARINAKFKTAYTRNAAIGRARRLGIAGPERPKALLPAKPTPLERVQESHAVEPPTSPPHWPTAAFNKVAKKKLRCAEVEPRHLALIELEYGDCRYPYGGDEEGEAITFCGHRCRPGSSYCTPHFLLSRDPVEPRESAADTIWLQIVAAA